MLLYILNLTIASACLFYCAYCVILAIDERVHGALLGKLENSMSKHPLELENAKTFLDIILGVIIALPLAELPRKAIELSANKLPSDKTVYLGIVTSMLLLISALIFSIFFWLEIREFIERQTKFNAQIQETDRTPGYGVHLARRIFFGRIIQIAFMVTIIEAAKSNYFRAYLAATISFWILDIVITHEFKRLYRVQGYTKIIANIKNKAEHEWFIAHIDTPFYYVYSFLHALFFGILFLISLNVSRQVNGLEWYRLAAAIFVLIVTLLGHLYFRAIFFWRWMEKKSKVVQVNLF